MHIAHKLKKKGWKKHHIAKTLNILKKAEDKKHPYIKILDKFIFSFTLAMIIFGNIVLLTALLPIIIDMPQAFTLTIFALVGYGFGLLIDNIIQDMELAKKHYFFAGILIALMATLSMFLVITLAKSMLTDVGILVRINPLLAVFVYIIAFTLPHVLYKIKDAKQKPF